MSKFTSSALVALLAAVGSQSIYAQGQSSGEDTQRRDQQQQQQPGNSVQSDQPGQYSSSSAQSQPSQAASSSTNTPSSQAGHLDVKDSTASQSNGAKSSQSSSGAPGQATSGSNQSRSSSASYNGQSQPGQQSTSSSSSNDAFKSDTSATGRISTQSSSQSAQPGQPGQSQGAPGSSESSSTRLNSGANAQVNQQHVTQFQNVFSNWRAGSNQEAQFTAAINAAAPGARIDHQYVTRFVTDFNTIIPRVQLSSTAQQRLATAFATVLSPTVEVTTLEPTLTEVRQVLVESGLSPIQAQTVACDLHLMAAQVHPNMLEVQVK